MTLRDLAPDAFARVSSLLDEAFARPLDERQRWLEALALRDPESAAMLRDLVASAAANVDGFLETREIVDRHLRRVASDDDALAGATVGPWRVLRPLGRGGMGTVWLAERADGLFQRRVALKLLQRHLDASAAERFAREREILAALEHPHIARLLDAGFGDDGRPYLALEYVDGAPLTAWCDARRLSTRERVKLFLQVAQAVAYAHANLVIHRDLKPSNVLVAGDGQVHLLDFGIAKLVRQDEADAPGLTQVAGPAFTPEYAAPEQVSGAAVTTASDVYALGVVLYELACGRRPYKLDRATRGALEDAILAADPPRPSHAEIDAGVAAGRSTSPRRLRRELAGDLDTIVMKALRKDPAQRYATADAFAQDLARHLRGEPVLARPERVSYYVAKFVARHRLGVAAAGMVTAALLVGAGVALWQAQEARGQAERAQREATKAKVVQDFLLDIFRTNSVDQRDPLKAQRTTARELLDLGAARAQKALEGSPEAQSEVFGTLAQMYYQLGLTDEAARQQRFGLDAARRAFGPADPRRAQALMTYADAVIDSAHRDELLPTLDEAKAILDAAGDATSKVRARLHAMYAKAHSYTSMSETRRYADAALDLLRTHHADTTNLQGALSSAAIARFRVGEYDGAEALYREALADARRRQPGPSAAAVIPLIGLAQTRDALGDLEGAEAHFREALATSRAIYGEQHGETIQSAAKLGRFLHRTARRVEARQLLDEAAGKAHGKSGDAVPEFVAAVVASIRGAALLAEGRLDEAEPLIAFDLADARANYPGSQPLATALRTHAPLSAARGRFGEALAMVGEAIDIIRPVMGAADPAILNGYRLERSRVLLDAGQPQPALDEVARVVAPRNDRRPVAMERVRGEVIASRALLMLGRLGEAQSAARSALERIVASPQRAYHAEAEADAAQRLGEALLHASNAADACPLLERAVRLRSELDASISPSLAQARLALAACLADIGDRAAAVRLEQAARAVLAAQPRLGPQFRSPIARAN